MSDMYCCEKMKNGSWMLATMFDISGSSNSLTNIRVSELLLEFAQDGCYYELIVEPDQSSKTHQLLIFRKNGLNLDRLSYDFEKTCSYLLDRLRYDGLQVTQKSKEETVRIVNQLNGRKQLYLCIPEANTSNFNLCYIPGGYVQVQALDMEYLYSLLSTSSNAGISFQFNYTVFSPYEIQTLNDNIAWINNKFGDSPETRRALKIFESYLSISKEKTYFVCMSVWGEEEFLGKVFHNLQAKGYKVLRLPMEAYYNHNYAVDGPYILTKYAVEKGHFINPKFVLPGGLERLEYLATSYVIDKFVNLKADPNSESNKDDFGTVPSNFKSEEGLLLGKCMKSQESVYLPLSQIAKHMTIAGMSGSGKTTFLFQLLLELRKKNIPFLIIEPTKTEYRTLMNHISDFKIYTPGKTSISPVMFNPFLPPKGVMLEQYIPSLISAFQLAFSMTTPLDVIFAEAVRNCYAQYGWRNDSTVDSPEITKFGMHEFICSFKEEINRSAYDIESKQNLNSGGVYRLQSLINYNPYLFDADQSLDFDNLLKGYTLIELDAIDNQEQKSLFMSMLLLQMKLVIRQTQKKNSQLKNVILVDEAHVLLDVNTAPIAKNEANASARIEDYFLDMVKVNRVYGTGMIFADQSLAILKSFVNNSNIKLALHLESFEERNFLMNNLNLSENMSDRIVKLDLGQFLFACEALDKPLLVQMEDVRRAEAIEGDVDDDAVVKQMKPVFDRPFIACACKQSCDMKIRNEADFIAKNVSNKFSRVSFVSEELDETTKHEIDEVIRQMASESEFKKKLIPCAQMMTYRMLQRKAVLSIEEDE